MTRIVSLIVVSVLSFGVIGCANKDRAAPSATTSGWQAQAVTARTVEAGCATCIFDMQGVEGCTLAVRIDGRPYLVTGAGVDAHGAGLCRSVKKAQITGKFEGDKFVATSFAFQP